MKRTPVVHPFLFSLFPALALYAYNVKSHPLSLGELAGPLALSLVCATALFLVLRTVLKDPAKAGLLVSLLILWFYSFGHVAGQVAVLTGGIFNRSFFFATAVILGLVALLVVRSRRSFKGLTGVLNVVATALIVFNLVSVGQTLARRSHVVIDKAVMVSQQGTARPNIYYIILDAYTRADILRDVFSFDNTGFLSGLEAKGFFVASKSYANYGYTYHSLAASLNFTYLDAVAEDVGTASTNQEPLYRMIQENRVMAFLKSRGYRVTCLSSDIKPGDMKNVDRYLGYEGSPSEFRTALLNTTPIPLFIGPRSSGSPYDAHRKRILDAFRTLDVSAAEAGPYFFFVHLMSPHPPFVFGPNGEPVEPDYLFSMVDADRLHGLSDPAIKDYIVRYREQVAFLNKKILEAVDFILSRSPQPPIIILQGDHGSRAYTDFDHPEASYFKESLAILNAYLLPGDGRTLLYPEISPVNSFRLIFKHFFGADLDLIPDKSAWSTWRHPYRFIPFEETSYAPTVESVRKAMKPKAPVVQKR
jgi:hypothetical protein